MEIHNGYFRLKATRPKEKARYERLYCTNIATGSILESILLFLISREA